MVLVSPMEQLENGNGCLRFLPDSAEQITESMERLGPLWDQLCEAFQAAIARVNKGLQESDRPAIDETEKGDLEGAPVKQTEPGSP